MLKRLLLLITFVCLLSISASAQFSKIQGYSQQGGSFVVTSGINSASKYQKSFPNCTVTVFAAGTSNLATIYSDSIGTPKSNPFTADSTGYWFFYSGNGTYDVQFSGNGITNPFTLGDFKIGDATAGISGSGTVNLLTKWVSSGSVGNSIITDTGTNIGINNTTPQSSALLDLTSTSKALLVPRMTTTQRDAIASPTNGLIIYNTTTAALNLYTSSWGAIGGGGLASLNGLVASSQTFSASSDTNITIAVTSSVSTHTFTAGWNGTLSKARQNASTAYIDAANSWSSGIKQTFSPSATTAGVNVGSLAADVSTPANGDLWYNTNTNQLMARIGGSNIALGSGGGGGGVTSIGALDGNPKSANGLSINTATLFAQSADASFPGLVTTGTQTLAGAKTFTTGLIITDTGVALNLLDANLVDPIAVGGDTPQRFGLSYGTNASAITSRFPTISFQTFTKPAVGGGNTTSPYLFYTDRQDGGAQPAIYSLFSYAKNEDTAVSPNNKDVVAVAGITVATAGGTGRAFGGYFVGNITNNATGQGAIGAELDVQNDSGIDSPVPTASLPAGYLIGLAIAPKGGKLSTAAIDIQGSGTSAWRTGIHFPADVIATGGYGIDFKYATRGLPIRLPNTASLATGYIYGRDAADANDKKLIGVGTTVSIDGDGLGTTFGAAIRPGNGAFAANTPQIYTSAAIGLVVTAQCNACTYDFLLSESGGNTLLRNAAGTNDLEVATTNGNAILAGNNGAIATNATTGFVQLPSSAGIPTGAPVPYTGYVPFEVNTTFPSLYAYVSATWIPFQPTNVGGNVASAGTIAGTGALFHVTGAVNITAISTTNVPSGSCYKMIFDSTPLITNGATLKLAGTVNYTPTAGTAMIFCYDGTAWQEFARAQR